MQAPHEYAYQLQIGDGLGRVFFNCIAEDDEDARRKASASYPDREIVATVKINRPPVPKARFCAYRIYPHDPGRRSHFVSGLPRAQANDVSRFPLGPQKDEDGNLFIWSYGLGDGTPI